MANIKNSKTERGRVRFNVLDAFIIILVIAAVVGVYFRYSILDFLRSDMNAEKYVVTYSMDDIRYTTPNYIHADDKVYFASSGELFGTIIRESENQGVLNIMPASKEFVDSKGDVKEVFYPNSESRVTAKGKLVCEGYYDPEGGFFVDGNTYIAAGQTIEVRTETVSVRMSVLSIEAYAE